MADEKYSADAAYAAASEASGGMPQFDFSTWGSQIFWLVITFGVLYFVLARFILPRLAGGITERGDRIADDLDAAARMQREAEEAEAEYEKSLADARAKAHHISATTRGSVEAEIASELEVADAEMARDQAAAEARIAGIRQKAMSNVDSVAADTASEILSKLTGLKVSAAKLKSAIAKG